jgi:RNA polymerase sigma factor (sigma-70 family)
MRHLLVNYAERRRAAKRGGGASRISLDQGEANPDSSVDFNPVTDEVADELIALHEALERLGGVSERQVRVVEARFYVGLSIDETAQTLGISPATVKRDWQVASAWLHREIRPNLNGA